MRKLPLILLVILAAWMAGRAVKRNADVMAALWLLLGMTATAGTAGTAKSRSTEDRLNSLIPAVFPNTGGTVTGSMTVNGNHNVGGQLNVGAAGGSATVAVNGTVHASSTGQFDGGVNTASLSVNGGTGSATVAISGNVHASSTGQFDGGVTTSVISATSGSTNEFSGGIHTAGAFIADGTISASNFSGTYRGGQGAVSTVSAAPATYSASAMTAYGSAINGIIARLNSSGLI